VVGPRYIPGAPVETAGGDEEVVDGFAGTGWAQNTDQVPDAARITPPVLPPGDGGRNRVELRVDLDPGFELGYLDSSYHDVLIREPEPAHYEVELRDGSTLANRDFELVWRPVPGQEVRAALFSEQVGDATYALLLVVPPSVASAGRRLPRETIFVVDVSGSMSGASIEQAKIALRKALNRLEPGDRFEMISFSDRAAALFGGAVPVDESSLRRARTWISHLEAEGGTEMLSALRLALESETPAEPEAGAATPVGQVVFITDGDVGNEEALFSYIEQHLGTRRLFPVGIGSAPNAHFMERAARFGRGAFTYIGKPEEVEERMASLFKKLEAPQLTDLEAVWPDGAAEVWPDRLPDLYQGEPIVVTARLEVLAGEVGLTGRRGQQPWSMKLGLAGGGTGSGIDKLWARRKIAALMDDRTLGAEEAAVRSEVVDIALAHHLVSKYTSLVAVDVTPVRPAGESLETAPVPTELPAGWNHEAVFGSLPQGATAGRAYLLGGLLLILAALVLRPGRRERVR
ncbi:MAG: VWA domain-containing protein, partial [Acidobacteria bacterium]|nr:VWA domain-containing protein [Acidobacteriota bacterium]